MISFGFDSVRNTFDVENGAHPAAGPLVYAFGLFSGLELCFEHKGSPTGYSSLDWANLDSLIFLSWQGILQCLAVDNRHNREYLLWLRVLQCHSVEIPPGSLQFETGYECTICCLLFDLIGLELLNICFDE